jgi:hypothetical protein
VPPNPHIRNAAANLLGVSLIIVVAIDLTDFQARSIADEMALIAALFFGASCILSHLSTRKIEENDHLGPIADRIFIAGLLTLILAVGVLAVSVGLSFPFTV